MKGGGGGHVKGAWKGGEQGGGGGGQSMISPQPAGAHASVVPPSAHSQRVPMHMWYPCLLGMTRLWLRTCSVRPGWPVPGLAMTMRCAAPDGYNHAVCRT